MIFIEEKFMFFQEEIGITILIINSLCFCTFMTYIILHTFMILSYMEVKFNISYCLDFFSINIHYNKCISLYACILEPEKIIIVCEDYMYIVLKQNISEGCSLSKLIRSDRQKTFRTCMTSNHKPE